MTEHGKLECCKDSKCIWVYSEEQEEGNAFYDSACGHSLFFLNFSKTFKYCMFCGKPIEIVYER